MIHDLSAFKTASEQDPHRLFPQVLRDHYNLNFSSLGELTPWTKSEDASVATIVEIVCPRTVSRYPGGKNNEAA